MITAISESFSLAQVFTISRGSKTEAQVVTVRVTKGAASGQGECVPYARYGESTASVIAQIEALPQAITRTRLQETLPPGAARNAVDCALWDLEAKTAGQRVWELAGLPAPAPVTTAYTLSLAAPEVMEAAARAASDRPVLKIKLGTPDDMPRLEAVRRGAPHARLIIDANEGWSADIYRELAPRLVDMGVMLVEQPLPAGQDEALSEMARPLPVCADESCHDRTSLALLQSRYDVINIKLDKTGGLTEALALRDEALKQGFGIMVGCMVGSSLAMAPAVLLAQGASYVDLDGPLLLAEDPTHALRYSLSQLHPPERQLWG